MTEEFEYEKERHYYNLLRSKPIFWSWYNEQLKCQSNKCAWCEKELMDDNIETEHIQPIFHGGVSTSNNMVLSCHECNIEKMTSTVFSRPTWIEDNKFSNDLDRAYHEICKTNQNNGTLFNYNMYNSVVQQNALNDIDRLVVAKDKEYTSDIRSVRLITGDKCEIVFKNGKDYTYHSENVSFEPVVRVYNDTHVVKVDDEPKSNVKTLIESDKHSKIIYNSNYTETFPSFKVEVIGSCLDDPENRKKFDYYKHIVNEIEDLGLKNDNDERILQKYFNEITYIRDDVVLDEFLRGQTSSGHGINHNEIIYPFGMNESQRQATINALNNKISIIEGPPGTGKTNTILNIISNIVNNNKTVAVVSNNNSATDNVYEKLTDNDFNIIAARLGKMDNKKAFIESQDVIDKDKLSTWQLDSHYESAASKRVAELENIITEGYHHQNNIAIKRTELKELKTEKKHFEKTNKSLLTHRKDYFRHHLSSDKILKLWHQFDRLINDRTPLTLLRKIYFFIFGKFKWKTLRYPKNEIVSIIKYQYYEEKIIELKIDIARSKRFLKTHLIKERIAEHTKLSKQLFKNFIAKKYLEKDRKFYNEKELWSHSKDFIEDYPVVLSTTYSLRKSLNPNFVYDYIIVDEASQVDLATFVLAISCAKKLVLVGDEKQLPNVVKEVSKTQDAKIFEKYDISEEYQFSTNSALSSVRKMFGGKVPSQMLREHYRCHPDIIGFCNKRFYNDELIILTPEDKKNNKPLGVYYTVAGNHARERMNQRQIDVTLDEIVPNERLDLYDGSVGIIAPYRNHTFRLREILKSMGADATKASTVDAFQGRERDTIIINTVDNQISDFASDPNRLNVAVSRAKKHLFVVVNGNNNTNNTGIDELVRYIKYRNGVEEHSKIRSIFDNLYSAYYFYRTEHNISDFPSENLMCDLLVDILVEYEDLDFEFQYPLSLLCDLSSLSGRELEYASNELTKVDFVIYRRASKTPILAIEVDGWVYHQDAKQKERDANKNKILKDAGLPILRLATNESGEKERIKKELDEIVD